MTPYQLGETYSKEALPLLKEFLESKNKNEVRLAASGIRKISKFYLNECKVLKPFLLKALEYHDGQTRQYILKVLEIIIDNKFYDDYNFIIKIASLDDKEYNREAAIRIINKFTDYQFNKNHDFSSKTFKTENTYFKNIDNNDLNMSNLKITIKDVHKEYICNVEKIKQIQSNQKSNHIKPVVLTGEQRKVLNLPSTNPVLIKGPAGSGKTTIAIYRAKHLLSTESDFFVPTEICIFSYTKSLAKYIKSIIGNDNIFKEIHITTLHSWLYWFLNSKNYWDSNELVTTNNMIYSVLNESLTHIKDKSSEEKVLTKSLKFFLDEFEWIKGMCIENIESYINTKRSGRGKSNQITSENKQILWNLYVDFQKNMKNKSLATFSDLPTLARNIILNDQSFRPPFSHIIIDEAQDLSKAELQLLNLLVIPETNSITILADTAQKIYNKGFTWSSLGFDIKGSRNFKLKKNYRNTLQIYDVAMSLLKKDPNISDYIIPILPLTQGNKPRYFKLNSNDEQLIQIVDTINSIDYSKESIVITHRSRNGLNLIKKTFNKYNINVNDINYERNNYIRLYGLYLCTMPSLKGLEFDHVILCNLDNNVFPMSSGMRSNDYNENLNTERRLLYTCITRAKTSVTLISTSKPTCFIDEINKDYLELYTFPIRENKNLNYFSRWWDKGETSEFSKRIKKNIHKNISFKINYDLYKNEINKRKISYLVHFTTLFNLLTIINEKAILSRNKLVQLSKSKPDLHLFDFLEVSDKLRLDNFTNYVNLSIQHPNYWLLQEFIRTNRTESNKWCILKLSPDIIWHKNTMFSISNAASNKSKMHGIDGTFEKFVSLFEDDPVSIQKSKQSSRINLKDCYPTDMQAEVLAFEFIPISYVLGVIFNTETDLKSCIAAIATDSSTLDLKMSVNPSLFQEIRK